MQNQFWQQRYNKFIKFLQNRELPVCSYYENHHILPRCMGGSNDETNLIKLSLREHFLCHYMLAKANPILLSIVSAYIQMCNKNSKLVYKNSTDISLYKSRLYEKLKNQMYHLMSEHNFDKVHCTNKEGIKVCVTKEEFKKGEYTFHTKGKVRCLDLQTNKTIHISTDEYSARKNNGGVICQTDDQIFFTIKDRLTEDTFKISKVDWDLDPRKYEKVLKKIKYVNRYFVWRNYEKCPSTKKLTFTVTDLITNETVVINKETYYNNPSRYNTTTKGRKVAKIADGTFAVVDADADFPGTSAGLTTVFDIEQNQYVQITVEEFRANKSKYRGPTTGKKNIRSIYNVGYYQVDKNHVMEEGETGSKREHMVFNKITRETKYITKHECVNDDWILIKRSNKHIINTEVVL